MFHIHHIIVSIIGIKATWFRLAVHVYGLSFSHQEKRDSEARLNAKRQTTV